jgi:hypothetical protein
MTQQTIGVGTTANDGTGDTVRAAFTKCNANFTELYGSDGAGTLPAGRLTLATGTPVMQATVSGATTVYYTPYYGLAVPLYNGTSFVATSIGAELSQLTTDATKSPAAVAASSVYDMFVWSDAGTIRCTRGPAWTNPTTRSMALTQLNGVLVNSAAITNGAAQYRGTYVGTIASNGASTIDWILGAAITAARLMVWNYYNRVNVITRVTDTQAAYTYQSATVRQAGGSTYNQINYVCGVAEDAPDASYQQTVATAATAGATNYIGVGDDSITAFETVPGRIQTVAAAALTASADVRYQKGFGEPMLGVHYLAALEAGDGAVNIGTYNVGQIGELSFAFMM